MYKKILIINPFGIGDVLFTTPIIRILKEVYAPVKIGYLCNRRACPLLESNPYVNSIFIYEKDEFEAIRKISFFAWIKKYILFLRQIKKERFDLAFDFSLNTQFGFFSWCAGIKKRVGYDFRRRGRFLTKKIKLTGYDSKHIVEYYVDLLKYAGIEIGHLDEFRKKTPLRPQLYIKEEDKRKAVEILARENVRDSDILIGIIPGGGRSWGKEAAFKHWPADKFAQLADKIVEILGAKIIIMGDSLEQNITEEVILNMRHKPIDLTGKTSVRELAAVLGKMKLIVTNDGGPLHIAAAVGIRTVSIFGPVDEKVYGPYLDSDKHMVAKKDLFCRPCYKNFRFPECLYERKCINQITVEDVFAKCSQLLEK